MKNKLEWYVYVEDINKRKIEPFNVFDSGRFYKCLLALKKEMKKDNVDFDYFSSQLDKDAKYCFWAKCEYEIYLSSMFTHDDFKKVDVYAQLQLNWDKFARYVYDNIKLVKEIKWK